MKKYNIIVVGATGTVGREVLRYLEDTSFQINKITAVASEKSLGKTIEFKKEELKVATLAGVDFAQYDIAFFCAGSEISKKYVEKAAALGCLVIDKSSYFRMHKDVPLIVPEVNANLIKTHKNIIANPNCCAIPISVVLKILDNYTKITRTIISTYQSTSGAGKSGMDELFNQTKAKFSNGDLKSKVFSRQIAFNLIPQIGEFLEDGSTQEEKKITEELIKILGPHVNPCVTCVRVPIFVSHSMSVNVEFKEPVVLEEVIELLSEQEDIRLYTHEGQLAYLTPLEVVGEDLVIVSRVRKDPSNDRAINMWVAVDNLRKGAALNAVQIAEFYLR